MSAKHIETHIKGEAENEEKTDRIKWKKGFCSGRF